MFMFCLHGLKSITETRWEKDIVLVKELFEEIRVTHRETSCRCLPKVVKKYSVTSIMKKIKSHGSKLRAWCSFWRFLVSN